MYNDVRISRSAILPEIGFVRLPQVLDVIPVKKSAWWAGIKDGRFPKGLKLGPRTTVWRVEDIRALIDDPGRGFSDDQKAREAVTA